ncbi:MAG TPA: hypothetical protein VEE84_09270 [Burkholderiaceae bacterium]|nr:hypothetical protein [Burkholderiaceae bacterium]
MLGSSISRALLGIALALVICSMQAASAQDPEQQCGEKVAQMYREQWPNWAASTPDVQARMLSHYNTSLGKCVFLEVVSGSVRSPALDRILPREAQRLGDADQNRNLGRYDGWDGEPPVTCWVQDNTCSSKQDWEQLIKPYLTE